MNKKGFTLVELLVAIMLLALVMAFLTSMVLSVRDMQADNSFNAELSVTQASISKLLYPYINDAEFTCSDGAPSFTAEETLKIISNNNKKTTIRFDDKTETNTIFIRTVESGEFGDITCESVTNTTSNKNLYTLKIQLSEEGTSVSYDIILYSYH